MTSCWVITEGLIGTQNQCVALAHAAGLDPQIKIVKLKQPWKSFTPWILHFSPQALAPGSTPLTAPWPDVIIASGRKALAPSVWIKQQSKGKTKLVIVQSPIVKNSAFDLVVAPQHDQYRGAHTLQTVGALSVVSPEKMAQAKHDAPRALIDLPSPRVAVMIGGDSRTHQLTSQVVDKMIVQLQDLLEQGYSLMVTTSRRTRPELHKRLYQSLQHERVFFWDGNGKNPYFAFLALADMLLVTEDSVSMASEALSTGKPVYLMKMEGGSDRFARFHDNLVALGYARWFTGVLEHYNYTAPDDLAKAAEVVRKLITIQE